jgi:hypothetical protein
MRGYYLIPFFILTFAALSIGQPASEWQKFVVPDKSCSVLLPDAPKMSTDNKDTPAGTVLTDIWISKTGTAIYLIGITTYPVDVETKKELELDRDNFLKAVNAKLVDDSEITLGGRAGLEFTGVSDTYTFKSRVFYKNKRVTQIVAGERTDKFDVSLARKALDSFAFADQ